MHFKQQQQKHICSYYFSSCHPCKAFKWVAVCQGDLFSSILKTVSSESGYVPKCVFSYGRMLRGFTSAILSCCVCASVHECVRHGACSHWDWAHICISTGMCEHVRLQLTNCYFFLTTSLFLSVFCVSLHMRLRSINLPHGDLWSAAGERNTPLTHSAYMLFGSMIYELCPRVAGFIFLLLTAPPRRLGPLWDERKEKPDFLTLGYIKRVRMSNSFSLWWSWDGVS